MTKENIFIISHKGDILFDKFISFFDRFSWYYYK
jgi:hypothetical protein